MVFDVVEPASFGDPPGFRGDDAQLQPEGGGANGDGLSGDCGGICTGTKHLNHVELQLFCHDHHGYPRGELCADCSKLMSYAYLRLAKCPFGREKTTCNQCPIHCYRPSERDAMKAVMRYAGPRMLLRHPALSLRHLWMEHKGAPPWPPRARRAKTEITAAPPPA